MEPSQKLRPGRSLPDIVPGPSPDDVGLSFHVYVIRSDKNPTRYYIGFSAQPKQRLIERNAGKNPSTADYAPWRLAVVIGFPTKNAALKFERYLKGGSGRAFLKRHLLL